MQERFAKVISIIFHPVLIPTIGFFLLFNSGFHYSMLSWEIRRYILLVVLFSTGIMPLISVAILAVNPKFDVRMTNHKDRMIPLLSSAIFYYLGFLLLARLKAFPSFKLYLLASAIVIIALLLISFKWKISLHMAAVGGLTAAIFAISFRTGVNPLWAIIFVTVISGLVGTARLILNKHNLTQLVSGYALGFGVLYFAMYYI